MICADRLRANLLLALMFIWDGDEEYAETIMMRTHEKLRVYCEI